MPVNTRVFFVVLADVSHHSELQMGAPIGVEDLRRTVAPERLGQRL